MCQWDANVVLIDHLVKRENVYRHPSRLQAPRQLTEKEVEVKDVFQDLVRDDYVDRVIIVGPSLTDSYSRCTSFKFFITMRSPIRNVKAGDIHAHLRHDSRKRGPQVGYEFAV